MVGLAAEARLLRRLRCLVEIGGGTSAGAEAAASLLVQSGAAALISFGLAGGLDPALRPGDILVPAEVFTGGGRLSADEDLSRALGGLTPHMIFGSASLATDAAAKRQLCIETGAAGIDLESGAVARIAVAHGLPFAVLRAICDPAERALPAAATLALNERGIIGVSRVLRSVAAHPWQVAALLALAADAAAARRALRQRIASIDL